MATATTTAKGSALQLRPEHAVPAGAAAHAGETFSEAVLAVEGIHCAACTQLIEMRVAAVPGVESVSVSPVTHRARVRWRGQSATAEAATADAAIAGRVTAGPENSAGTTTTTLQHITGAIGRAGYRAWPVIAGMESPLRRRAQRIALWRLFVAGFSMMQVMMYAFPAYLASDGEMPADIDALLKIASFVLTAPVLLFSAVPFFRGAWRDAQLHRIGMDVPVTIGILVTFGASHYFLDLDKYL